MIKNEIVALRALEPSDVDILYQWENDTHLWNVSNTLAPFSKYQLQQYIKHSHLDIYQTQQLRLMIEHAGNNEVVGMVDLFDFEPFHHRGGIGIMIHDKWRGEGLAFEALQLFVGYLFGHLGLHQVYATVGEDNEASVNLFQKSGFELTGRRKEWCRRGGLYADELFFQKINRR